MQAGQWQHAAEEARKPDWPVAPAASAAGGSAAERANGDIPHWLATVLATYGIQAPSLSALAAALLGAGPTGGRCPVRLDVDPG